MGTALLPFLQAYRLPVLLQLRNELVTLPHNVVVLLVLLIWPVRFDDTIDAVDRARYLVGCDEVLQVPTTALANDKTLIHDGNTYLSRKSTLTPNSFAMLCRPTTR